MSSEPNFTLKISNIDIKNITQKLKQYTTVIYFKAILITDVITVCTIVHCTVSQDFKAETIFALKIKYDIASLFT